MKIKTCSMKEIGLDPRKRMLASSKSKVAMRERRLTPS
jgi:hypothetical protein